MRRYAPPMILVFCLIALVYVNGLNLFVVGVDSENEAMRYLIIKGIELQRDATDPIICSDNIQEYNLTGYTLMSYIDIQKKADLEGDTSFIWVGVPRISGNDIYINVIKNVAVPSDSGKAYLGASGAEYRFHRYFWSIWGYSINAIIMS
jgi:hypothetical protein